MKIQSKNCHVQLDKENGKLLSLKSFSGREYLSSYGSMPLITLKIMDEKGQRQVITSDFSANMTAEEKTCGLTLFYKNFGGIKIDVTANIFFDGDGFLNWNLSFDNNTDYLVEWINYPSILLENKLHSKGGEFKLFLPIFEGVEISDYSLRKKHFNYIEMDYPSKGWEGVYPGAAPLQYMSYYNDIEGFYIGMHDCTHNLKEVDAVEKWNGIKLATRLMTGTEEKKYNYEFNTVIGFFNGNWYDSADIYRNFIENSNFIKQPKIYDNPKISKWLFDSPVVVAYPVQGERDTGDMSPNMYYPYTNALPYLEKLKQNLDSRLLVLLCQWEGTAPWCPPFVWPPYGDLDNFNKYADSLRSSGNLLGLYCSGISWTEESLYTDYQQKDYFTKKQLNEVMCLAPDQSLFKKEFIRYGYDMCPSSNVTKDIIADETKKIADSGKVDYIQLFDQNLGGNPSLCYAKNHGHPRIPGKWQIGQMRDLIKKAEDSIRQSGEEIMLGCECASGEGFTDLLLFNDARNFQGFSIGRPMPAYNYIYHEYLNNFMGNQVDANSYLITEENLESIFYRVAHFFAQGDLLAVTLKDHGKVHWDWNSPWDEIDVEQESYLNFVKTLNNWRKNCLKEQLISGKMIKPLRIECGEFCLKHKSLDIIRYPSVITTRWLSGDNDCQIFVNYSKSWQTFKLYFNEDIKTFCISTDYKSDSNKRSVATDCEIKIAPHSVIKMTLNKE